MFIVWVLFAVFVWMITILLVKWDNFKRLWLAGIIGIVLGVVIDSPLAKGELYRFYYHGISINGLPIFYILALAAGAIFIIHFYPWGNMRKGFLFFLLANALFLVLEFLMVWIGYFEHIQWSYAHSFVLNLIGFLTTTYVYALLHNIFGKMKYSL